MKNKLWKLFSDSGETKKEEASKAKPRRRRTSQCHAKTVATSLLDTMGCKTEWEDGGDGNHTANLMFQGGHFVLNVWDRHNYGQIIFPGIYEGEIDELDIIRSAANRINLESIFTRVVTTISDSDGNVHCHVTSHVMLDDDTRPFGQALHDALIASFHVREDLVKIISESKEHDDDDPELTEANTRRDVYLINEQAWSHTEEHVRLSSHCQDTFTLCEMLRRMFDWQDAGVANLRIIHGTDVTVLLNASDYKLLDALFDEQGRVVHEEAVIIMTVVRDELQFKHEHAIYPQRMPVMVTAIMRVTHTDEMATYVQVTLTREAAACGEIRTLQHPEQKGDAVTFMIGYDRQSEEDRHNEYKFMLADAQHKVQTGDASQLATVQEIMMANDDEYSVGYNVYWGEFYARQRRYAEAIVHFVSAYEQLSPRTLTMSNKQLQHFNHIMYMTGLCYSRLGQKEKAFYYLDAAAFTNNTPYIIELLDLLVNSSDVRADVLLQRTIAVTQDTLEEGEEDSDSLQNFIRFLNMRRAYLCIEQHKWDLAELILEDLMQEPEARDFALNELAYLSTLREQEKRDKPKSKGRRKA